MTIQAMTFSQVAKAVRLTREQLYATLRATELIESVGFERVYQTKRGSKQGYMTERFDGTYIINNSMGQKDANGKVVFHQLLDSRIIDVLNEQMCHQG